MMEERQHNNLWAEKLSQVSLPDSGMAWMAMEVILDEEMPTGWRRDRRRWLLLGFLLLLLIGVCNCPGRGRFSAVTSRWSKAFETVPAGDKIARGPSPGGTPVAGNPSNATRSVTPAGEASTTIPAAIPGANSPLAGDTAAARSRYTHPTTTHSSYTPTAPVKNRHLHTRSKNARAGGSTGLTGSTGSPESTRSPGSSGSPGSPGSTGSHGSTGSPGSPETGYPDSGSPPPSTPSARASRDSVPTLVRKPVVKDSTHKKPPLPPTPSAPPKKKSDKKREGGFMAGIGLNQFFTVGGQQASSWNSGGITGTLSDYIPVPMLRYYFNSRLYVQLEAQINTPQYTKKNLVINETGFDSTGPTTSTQSSVSINKLFYFNVPLSVHYTVFGHLDLGTGLQFSRLTNGIGVFNDDVYLTNANGPSRTTVTAQAQTQTKSFKGDSTYREIRTDEFRFLLDGSYTWQRFILGLRYNQALSRFIDVRLSTGQITQARNSSLQLYLRYILWDGRKKKPLLPAK
jgi:hypothetical protein